MAANQSEAENICIDCGLCCDGSLFSFVSLQPADDVAALARSGIELDSFDGKQVFWQPCRQFNGGCCSIYTDRPANCRSYRCALKRQYDKGAVSFADARAIIDRIAALDIHGTVRPGLEGLVHQGQQSLGNLTSEASKQIDRSADAAALRKTHGAALVKALAALMMLKKHFVVEADRGNGVEPAANTG